MAVSSPMHLFQKHIIAQIRTFDLIVKEKLELLPRRVGRCTPMTTDSKRPARICIFQCGWPVLSVQPAFQQARHKPVTCAQHIKHLYRKTWTGLTFIKAVADFLFEDYCPSCATLAYQSSGCDRAHSLQRRYCICAATGNMKFFFCAYNQLKQVQRRLQLFSYLL